MTQDNSSTPDRLVQATIALRQTPTADGSLSELILRAERIPSSHDRKKAHWIGWIVAAMIFLGLGGVTFFLLQHTAGIAFADVVQSVNRTHTFTATLDIVSLDRPVHGAKYFARDQDMRLETHDWVQVVNHKTGQFLVLDPPKHTASVEQNIPDSKFDLYQILRNYQGGTTQPLGDKKIDGRDRQGFRTVLDDGPEGTVIFWVDKITKLPVRVENGPVLMSDLHFDVPLADSLFDTTVPAGYTLTQKSKGERFQFAGRLVDEQGKPIANVDVCATERNIEINSKALTYLGPRGTTDKTGHFTIDCSTALASENPIRLEFTHPDFLYARLEDLRLVSQEMRSNLQVRLQRGRSVTGQVVDESGHPVAGAVVHSICDHVGPGEVGNTDVQSNYAKQTATDEQGRFAIHGLPGGKIVLEVQKASAGAGLLTAQANLDGARSTTQPTELRITAKPLEFPAGTEIHELFGMKLVDVDASLRDRLSLGIWENVLVLDPGASISRLNIGTLAAGDLFWMANSTRINNFHEFAQQLLATCEAQEKQGRTEFDVRVVYDFTRSNQTRSSTRFMHLTETDLAELRRAVQP